MLRSLPSVVIICGRHTRISLCSSKSNLQKRFFYRSSSILYSFNDKDLTIPEHPPSSPKLYSADTDILYEQLRKSKSIPRVLELTSQHLNVMNNKHIVASFEVIRDSVTNERKALEGKSEVHSSLTCNETFQALCNHTLSRVRYMDPTEVITVFKTLSLMGVPNNTYIMQALLKMMCSQINQLSLSELSFLNFLLSRQKPSPAVDGLKMALPLVLQVQIENQLDSDNVNEVVNCLKVCSQARLKPATIQKIISALLKNTNALTGEQAVTVIFSLLNLDTPLDGYLELLNSVFHTAANYIEQLKVNQILHVVRLCNKFHFFHRDFLVASAKKAVEDRWNLEDSCELQKYLHKLFVFYPELLDLLCERIVSNAEIIRTDNKYSPLHLASYFALTNYRPVGLETALEILCTSEEKLSFMYESLPHFYTRFVSCLTLLGYFPERILEHVLKESFLMKAWSFGRKSGRTAEFEKTISSLLWSIEACERNKDFQIPSTIKKQVVQSVINKLNLQSNEFPLMKFLENGLGGSQFFCTGIFSRSGHIIDHALAMRNGNYPVSLSSINEGLSGLKPVQQITYIEDLCIPNDAKVVPIILAGEDSYCREPNVLKSWVKMKCGSLSKKNYFPVLINYPVWYNLPDREKIPYLMREIKQAVESEDLSRTNLP